MMVVDGTAYENEIKDNVRESTVWECRRNAGSFDVDLVFITPSNICIQAEVKSCKSDKINVASGKDLEKQYQKIISLREQGFNVIYVVRWKYSFRGSKDLMKSKVYDPMKESKFSKEEGTFLPEFLERFLGKCEKDKENLVEVFDDIYSES